MEEAGNPWESYHLLRGDCLGGPNRRRDLRQILENQMRVKINVETDGAVIVVSNAVRVMVKSETQDGESETDGQK